MATVEAPRPLGALAARVAAAAAALDDPERLALSLRETEGATYDEIAEELGVDAGDVAQLLITARLAVREAVRHAPPPPLRSAYCPDARVLLTLRQDDEYLTSAEVEWLARHVDGCDGCRAARRAFREATLAARAWNGAPLVLAPAPPPTVVPAVEPDSPPATAAAPVVAVPRAPRRAPARQAPTSTGRRRTAGVLSVGAVAAVAAGVGIIALSGDQPPRPVETAPAAAGTATPQPVERPATRETGDRARADRDRDRDRVLERRRAAARRAARKERLRLERAAEQRQARRRAAAESRRSEAEEPEATATPERRRPERQSQQPAATPRPKPEPKRPDPTATPRPQAPAPTSTPRPQPTSTPAPAASPAPTTRPDVVPGPGDEFCFEDDPDC